MLVVCPTFRSFFVIDPDSCTKSTILRFSLSVETFRNLANAIACSYQLYTLKIP